MSGRSVVQRTATETPDGPTDDQLRVETTAGSAGRTPCPRSPAEDGGFDGPPASTIGTTWTFKRPAVPKCQRNDSRAEREGYSAPPLRKSIQHRMFRQQALLEQSVAMCRCPRTILVVWGHLAITSAQFQHRRNSLIRTGLLAFGTNVSNDGVLRSRITCPPQTSLPAIPDSVANCSETRASLTSSEVAVMLRIESTRLLLQSWSLRTLGSAGPSANGPGFRRCLQQQNVASLGPCSCIR